MPKVTQLVGGRSRVKPRSHGMAQMPQGPAGHPPTRSSLGRISGVVEAQMQAGLGSSSNCGQGARQRSMHGGGSPVTRRDSHARCPPHGKAASPALLTFYFLLSGHKRCHFPPQNLAPSNRPCKWSIRVQQEREIRGREAAGFFFLGLNIPV